MRLIVPAGPLIVPARRSIRSSVVAHSLPARRIIRPSWKPYDDPFRRYRPKRTPGLITRVGTAAQGGHGAGSQNYDQTTAFNAITGNAIILFVRTRTTTGPTTINDTANNTYNIVTGNLTQDPNMYCFLAVNITGNANNVITVNYSGSDTFNWICAVQYSGLDPVAPTDIYGSTANNSGGTTDLTSGPYTSLSNNEVLLAAVSQPAFTTYTAGSPFTLVDGSIPTANNPNYFGGVEEYIYTGGISGFTAHITSGSSAAYTMLVVSFQAPVSGGSASPWGNRISRGFSGSPAVS